MSRRRAGCCGSGIGKVRPLIEGLFHHVVRETADDGEDRVAP